MTKKKVVGKKKKTAVFTKTMNRKVYEKELERLQAELFKLQEWIVRSRKKSGGDFRRTGCCGEGQRHHTHHGNA
jgi:hypothetical protein